jgi:chromosome segregation ATPase
MKLSFITLATFLIFSSSLITSCSNSAEKVDEAQNDVTKAKIESENANLDYLVEVENHRIEASKKITDNEKIIGAFKTKIANEKKDVNAEYEKQLAKLEQKNTELKQKLSDYKAEGKENWESFKEEFNRDIDELSDAFNDLTTNNVK